MTALQSIVSSNWNTAIDLIHYAVNYSVIQGTNEQKLYPLNIKKNVVNVKTFFYLSCRCVQQL